MASGCVGRLEHNDSYLRAVLTCGRWIRVFGSRRGWSKHKNRKMCIQTKKYRKLGLGLLTMVRQPWGQS